MLRFNVRSVVWFVVGLAVMVVGLFGATSAQASVIPMMYDNTTSTPLFVGGFEPGDPTVGTQNLWGNPVLPLNATTIVTAASQGISANEGSYVAMIARQSNPNSAITGLNIVAGSATGASDVITSEFGVYIPSTSHDVCLAPCSAAAGLGNVSDMGQFDLTKASYHDSKSNAVIYYDNAWKNLNATYTPDAWNQLLFTHTNGTETYTVSVNGSTPETVTFTGDGGAGYTGATSPLAEWTIVGNAASTTAYVDAVPGVPEPSTMVLLATGLLGLLAYAWRRRR